MTFEVRLEHNIILATAMAEGLSVAKISKLLGVSQITVKTKFKESLKGYTFKRKKKVTKAPYIKGTNVGKNLDTSRDADICERFASGQTLKVIGEHYGVCRERVRQILKRYGMTREHGGQSKHTLINARKRRAFNKERTAERLMSCYGCTIDQWKFLRAYCNDYKQTPIRRWIEQKRSAKERGIAWSLTLWDWWTIWCESGKYKERGRGMGKYVMGRIADTGGYSVGNVEILKHEDNSKDYYDVHFDEWYDKLMNRRKK